MSCPERAFHPVILESAYEGRGGGQDNLRELYKEWLRAGAPGPEEDIEFITQTIFDPAGWGEKSREERLAYQEQLEKQIFVLKANTTKYP